MTKRELYKMVQKNNRVIQNRYDQALLSKYMDSATFTNFLDQVDAITGNQSISRPNMRGLTKLKKSELERLYAVQQRFVKSKMTTRKGRREAEQKRKETLRGTFSNLTDAGYKVFISIMGEYSRKISELIELKSFSSTDIMEIIEENSITSIEDLEKAINIISEEMPIESMRRGDIVRAISDIFDEYNSTRGITMDTIRQYMHDSDTPRSERGLLFIADIGGQIRDDLFS